MITSPALPQSIQFFDVMPTEKGDWAIVVDGVGVTLKEIKSEAVTAARELARTHCPSRLLVRDDHGCVQSITPFVSRFRCALTQFCG